MTRKALVFAPSRPGDGALVCTRWIADRTIEALEEERIEPVTLLDAAATREGLDRSVRDDVNGLAFFSHGRAASISPSGLLDDAVIGADGRPALVRDNLHLARQRWVHAIACNAGVELGAQAAYQGAACFIGYDCALLVEWDPDEIPASIRPLVVALVTITTRNLACGVRDARVLRARANEIAEAIAEWCIDNPAHAQGLEATAHQLVSRLRCFPEDAPGQ